MNDVIRWGLLIAGALIVAVFGLKFLGVFGHQVGDTAAKLERKL